MEDDARGRRDRIGNESTTDAVAIVPGAGGVAGAGLQLLRSFFSFFFFGLPLLPGVEGSIRLSLLRTGLPEPRSAWRALPFFFPFPLPFFPLILAPFYFFCASQKEIFPKRRHSWNIFH
jgi:hypothetical protein